MTSDGSLAERPAKTPLQASEFALVDLPMCGISQVSVATRQTMGRSVEDLSTVRVMLA